MEDKLRRSSRLVKPHRDPQFLYDTDSVRCFAGRGSSGESTNPSIDNSGKNLETLVFSDIADLPIMLIFYKTIIVNQVTGGEVRASIRGPHRKRRVIV